MDFDEDDQGLDTLDEVSLDYFKAEPPNISPFGSSFLKWKVKGPSSGFRVKLEGMLVAKTGSKTVQPKSSHTYRLYAFAGRYSKFLGSAAVNVNLAQCISDENQYPENTLKYALQQEINKDTEIYFRNVPKKDAYGGTYFAPSEPEVIVTPGRIRFILKLGAAIGYFPDADVDIDVSFGLEVSKDSTSIFDSVSILGGRRVVPINVDIKVDVSVPWYVWALPLAIILLPMRLADGKERAIRKMRVALPRLVNEALLAFIEEPEGMEPHSVRIYLGYTGKGVIEVTFCPVELPPVVIE
ncbi:MAG: hypothetical protein ABR568_19985 [Pyrinomonadaceae bacterium]